MKNKSDKKTKHPTRQFKQPIVWLALGIFVAASVAIYLVWAYKLPSTTTATTPKGASRQDGAELIFQPGDSKNSAQNPAFSPDGRTLLFTLFHSGYNGGSADLITTTFGDTRKVRTLISDPDRSSVNLPGTSWNGPTGRIAFASDRDGRHEEIWTMPEGGGAPTQVTNHEANSGFLEPSFSPEGNWIVFEEDSGSEADQISSIWKVKSDGTGLTRLIDGRAGNTDSRQPNWSPKGDKIVIQQRARGSDTWQLFTISPDGSNLRQVTNGTSDTDASWSPDGKQLVYSSNYGGLPEANIFTVDANGSTPRRITNDSAHYDGAPSWSPDGAWIAFESYRGSKQESPATLWRIAVTK